MFWTLLALLLWVVLGGFISYYGDLQGRRWGKKRVSWFGMRPKHTAILITSLTGGFIAILSIGSAMLLVPTVRNVVLRGEEAIRAHQDDLANLKRTKTTSEERIAKTMMELNSIKEQRGIALARLADAEATRALKERQVAEIQKRDQKLLAQDAILGGHVVQLQKLVSQKEAEIARKARYAQALSREAARMKTDNANAAFINKDLGQQNLSLTRQNVQMAHSNSDLQTTRDQLTAKNNELQSANLTLASQNAMLLENNAGLKKRGDDIRAENLAIYNASKAAEQHVLALQAQVRDLTDRQDQLYRQLAGTNQSFTQSYSALRQGRLILRAGAELARRTLDSHQRADAIRRELNSLLYDASTVAGMRGAAPGENGRAVRIIAKRVYTSTGIENADEEASLEALVENLTGSDAPTVVVVNTVNNSVQGEQIVVELHARTISRIFNRGAVVASRRIDTRQSADRVIGSILDFLQKDVRDAAIKKGIIPKINPDTGMEEVGILGPAELMVLTERVRQAGGEVTLSAVAATALTSADSLDPGDSRLPGSSRTVLFQISRAPGRI